MSVAAVPAILSIAGMGAGLIATNSMMKKFNSGAAATLQSLSQQNAQNALDTMPKAPEAPTGNAEDAATNEAEAERQRQLAALTANEKAFNPTGGLGDTSKASTKKKTLGGTA